MVNFISTAYIMGGLGNQMFQVAHAVCQGFKNKKPSVFEPITFTPMGQSKPITNYMDNIFRNISFTDNIKDKKNVYEQTWNEPKLNFLWDNNIEFYGYFQSSKNFFGYDKEMQILFEPTEQFIQYINNKFEDLKNKRTTSIHIRRGDYLTINNILPTLHISYFKKCIDELEKDTDIFFVFSDDMEWVKNNIKHEKIIYVNNNKDYEDLWMISLCNNNIMSNSSFSWWGSFLNKNKNKRVLCPNIWFGPNGPNPYDNVYVGDWIKIKVKYENGELKYEE
jgi:hypothetical protein